MGILTVVGVKNSMVGSEKRSYNCILQDFDEKNNDFRVDWGNFETIFEDEGGCM